MSVTRPDIADIPRPGFWAGRREETYVAGQPFWVLDAAGDGRILTQEQTDILITTELWSHIGWGRSRRVDAALAEILGGEYIRAGIWGARHLALFPTRLGFAHGPHTTPTRQRGGIHTSAAVREIAWNVWGDRDLRYQRPFDTADAATIRFALLELD